MKTLFLIHLRKERKKFVYLFRYFFPAFFFELTLAHFHHPNILIYAHLFNIFLSITLIFSYHAIVEKKKYIKKNKSTCLLYRVLLVVHLRSSFRKFIYFVFKLKNFRAHQSIFFAKIILLYIYLILFFFFCVFCFASLFTYYY